MSQLFCNAENFVKILKCRCKGTNSSPNLITKTKILNKVSATLWEDCL